MLRSRQHLLKALPASSQASAPVGPLRQTHTCCRGNHHNKSVIQSENLKLTKSGVRLHLEANVGLKAPGTKPDQCLVDG